MPIDSKKILSEIRANQARLKSCAGPHDFVKINPETFFTKYRCTRCHGEIDGVNARWYMEGLKHETECIEEVRELAQARDHMKSVLREMHNVETCDCDECPICGIILCPYDCDEHLWKDGCPCCYGTPVDPTPKDPNAS